MKFNTITMKKFDLSGDLRCLILCAGRGRRMDYLTLREPKTMIKLKNKPLLAYIINYWKKYTNNFIFVVGYKKKQIINFIKTLPINYQFVEQKKPKGIADAIFRAKDLISDQFIVVLGDCICQGEFRFPKRFELGIGVWKTDNENHIKQGYMVEIKNNSVIQVKEKPKKIINNFCGMGYYFFNKKVFDYIKKTKSSELRNEKEITDVIQRMIKNGNKIDPVFFCGNYLNINYPFHIKEAEKIFNLNELSSDFYNYS